MALLRPYTLSRRGSALKLQASGSILAGIGPLRAVEPCPRFALSAPTAQMIHGREVAASVDKNSISAIGSMPKARTSAAYAAYSSRASLEAPMVTSPPDGGASGRDGVAGAGIEWNLSPQGPACVGARAAAAPAQTTAAGGAADGKVAPAARPKLSSSPPSSGSSSISAKCARFEATKASDGATTALRGVIRRRL